MRVEFVIGVGRTTDGAQWHYENADHALNRVARRITREFGGATVTEGIGTWVHDGFVQTEKCIVIVADAPEDHEVRAVKVRELAEYARAELRQIAVHVTTFHSASRDVYRAA